MIPTRRHMLQTASCGFGYLAATALCSHAAQAVNDLTPKTSLIRPRAQRVIFLCMSGGPAQLDTFDYKPQTGKKKHPGSVFRFRQYGECGASISELLPHTAQHADRLCILNGMHADTGNHAQSFLQLHTGERLRPRPSMGAWISYGLGTENQNLPGFISLNTSKPAVFSSEFLPPVYEGTPIGVNSEEMSQATISNIRGDHLSLQNKRRQLDLIQAMNRDHLQRHPGDARLDAVIQSMELGFRMQATAPELLDLSTETAATLERYRVGQQETLGTCKQTDFGRQCLLARRFAEAGVRFIEVNHGSWDQHKNHRAELTANCRATDAPIAALLTDLHERGLLEETLVVWGGEFGRPGLVPGDGKDETGHNPNGFTFWMAGGGVRAGLTWGSTDPTGARAVEGKIHFRDLHATILHIMGLDHENLSYQHEGRPHRLTGPEGGHVVQEILA
ncbi:MAG: DUF1501 domain-containing protein [Planctomycetaceae bacterium]|nr:DUF1501 domain-containing protein [Planctomycetaceae bacterium]